MKKYNITVHSTIEITPIKDSLKRNAQEVVENLEDKIVR